MEEDPDEKSPNHWTLTGIMSWTILLVSIIAVPSCAFVAGLIVPFELSGIVFGLTFGLGTYIVMRMTEGRPSWSQGARNALLSRHDPAGTDGR